MITITDKQFTPATLDEGGNEVSPSYWIVTASVETTSGSARTIECIEGPEDMTDDQIKAVIAARWSSALAKKR